MGKDDRVNLMQDTNTVEHYREREQRERLLASIAISPGVAAMHRDLADHYRQLIIEAERTVTQVTRQMI